MVMRKAVQNLIHAIGLMYLKILDLIVELKLVLIFFQHLPSFVHKLVHVFMMQLNKVVLLNKALVVPIKIKMLVIQEL